MTVSKEGLEYNILGCYVRIKSDQDNRETALRAITILQNEVDHLRSSNPELKDIDLAVLAALKLASEKVDIEVEYKENVLALKAGINDALNFIEEVSPGTMQN
jgi:cell division protein ZapA (FtsZ GTPase activity inhibitor)